MSFRALRNAGRLFVIFFLAATVLLNQALVPLAHAQATPAPLPENIGGIKISADSINAAIEAPTPNLANTTAYIYAVIVTLTNNLTGTDVDNPSDAPGSQGPEQGRSPLNSNPTTVQQALKRGGAVGGLGFLMSQMISQPPASAGTYMADVARESRFAGPAYAQGIGFGALNPILGTWKAFRDVAYYLLTIAFIITGFLILIRHKVSGKVAVTVQSALPKLVVTLLIITFSYAIAGLIVDAMFLAIYFIINIFDSRLFEPDARFFTSNIFSLGTLGEGRTTTDIALDTNIFNFTLNYVFGADGSGAWNASSALGNMVYDGLEAIIRGGGSTGADGIIARGATDLGGFLLSAIFTVIFGIALLIAMFRTFFALLMSYAGFVINVVMSPLILLQNAIPGGDDKAIENWLRNIVAGLAPFVVTVFMIFMSLVLTGSHTREGIGYCNPNNAGGGNNTCPEGSAGQDGLRLPLILTSDMDSEAFTGILGMGFMLLLPEAVNMTKKALKASGGIMDEYKDKAVKNFQEGWKGSGMIPGAKGIVSGAGIGAGLGGLVGGGLGYKAAQDRGMGGLETALATLGGAGAGAAGGAVIGAGSGVVLPIAGKAQTTVNKGVEEVKKFEKLSSAYQGWRQDQMGTKNADNAAQNTSSSTTNPHEGL